MKISKKTLIIILVVVAVAAWLLWKRGASRDGSDQGGTSPSTAEPDHTTLDYILSHITFNADERTKIEAYRQACAASNTKRQDVQAKAYRNNLSFDQQLVCEALWTLHTADGSWTDPRGWQLTEEVKNI